MLSVPATGNIVRAEELQTSRVVQSDYEARKLTQVLIPTFVSLFSQKRGKAFLVLVLVVVRVCVVLPVHLAPGA